MNGDILHHGITLRPVPDWPDYYAGDDGHLYSIKRGIPRRLRGRRGPRKRYLKVNVYKEGMTKIRTFADGRTYRVLRPIAVFVHQMIAAAWLPPAPSPDHQVDHIDQVHENNVPTNLQWLTQTENTRRYWELNPTAGRGSKHSKAKLTETDIPAIRALRGLVTGRRVAEMWGVSEVTVSHIWCGRRWQHVA